MADRDKQPLHVELLRCTGLDVLNADAMNAFPVAQDLVEHVVPANGDVALLEEFLLKDLLRPELVSAVDNRHLTRNVREIQRFFHRSVPAADDRDVLALVEEPVAGGAGRHAFAHELFLRFETKVAGRRTGRDDEGVARVFARIALEPDRPLVQVSRMDVIEHDLGFEALGMLLEALHQLGALHSLAVGRPVVHIGCRHKLSARREARDDNRLEIRARSVDGGGVTRRAGPEYEKPRVPGFFRHGKQGWGRKRRNSIALRPGIITRRTRRFGPPPDAVPGRVTGPIQISRETTPA